MKRIHLKEMFKSKYSPPFFEIMMNLPVKLKKHLILNEDIKDTIIIFQTIHELITNNLGIYGILAYIFTSLFAISLFIVMYLINKYRKEPYLRVISPDFCNMIVFGCIMNMVKILECLPPYSSFKAKYFYFHETLSIGLIYIPMFAITYRIYAIYQTKSFKSNFLNNKALLIIIISLISIPLLFKLIEIFSYDFYYVPVGAIGEFRFPEYSVSSEIDYDHFYRIYFYVIFIFLLFMIIATGKSSKKFGDICYTFIIFILNISSFITKRLLEKLAHKNYEKYFLLIIIFNGLTTLLCIYVLVGSRVLLICLSNGEYTLKSNQNCTPKNITEFIPLKAKKKDLLFLMDKIINVNYMNDNNSFGNDYTTNIEESSYY
eukprot:jgi/Orpsp1_1/1179096/evm.model.c7180000067907.1